MNCSINPPRTLFGQSTRSSMWQLSSSEIALSAPPAYRVFRLRGSRRASRAAGGMPATRSASGSRTARTGWRGRSRMRKVRFMGVCFLALAGAAVAAEIHGTVSEGGKTLPAKVPIKLDCSGTSASAETDQYGSYSLKIAASGECTVSLEYKKSSPSVKVTVYEKPSRYDLIVTEEAGKLNLTRK